MRMVSRIVAALVLLFALAACDPSPVDVLPSGPPPLLTGPTEPAVWGEPVPADPVGKAGPGSACPQTLFFDVPAKWKLTGDFSAAGGLIAGGLTLVCELDGKPAGVPGIMRVFRGPRGDLRTVAERFRADWAPNATGVDYRDTVIGPGGTSGLEVYFRNQGHDNREFLVISGELVFLVDWGGFDEEAHAAGMPAYVLARQSTGI
jgi:hypothetical protein